MEVRDCSRGRVVLVIPESNQSLPCWFLHACGFKIFNPKKGCGEPLGVFQCGHLVLSGTLKGHVPPIELLPSKDSHLSCLNRRTIDLLFLEKNLNLPKAYTINYIGINMIGAMEWLPIQRRTVMKTASVTARYLAGVIFFVFGLNGFLNFIPLPPPGGNAGQFMGALYASHYLWVIFAFQVIAAVLLLANRYVPLAVAVLAPVIVNILVFHALMAPSGLPVALFGAVLWVAIFVDVRPAFAGLFHSRSQAQA
jgi:putative oxidoreductase